MLCAAFTWFSPPGVLCAAHRDVGLITLNPAATCAGLQAWCVASHRWLDLDSLGAAVAPEVPGEAPAAAAAAEGGVGSGRLFLTVCVGEMLEGLGAEMRAGSGGEAGTTTTAAAAAAAAAATAAAGTCTYRACLHRVVACGRERIGMPFLFRGLVRPRSGQQQVQRYLVITPRLVRPRSGPQEAMAT